jgi:hypothetical protein
MIGVVDLKGCIRPAPGTANLLSGKDLFGVGNQEAQGAGTPWG